MPVHEAKQKNIFSLFALLLLISFLFYLSSHFSLVFPLSYSEYKIFNQADHMISRTRLSGVTIFSFTMLTFFSDVLESHIHALFFLTTSRHFLFLLLFNKELCFCQTIRRFRYLFRLFNQILMSISKLNGRDHFGTTFDRLTLLS
jgi:hypothetical protein